MATLHGSCNQINEHIGMVQRNTILFIEAYARNILQCASFSYFCESHFVIMLLLCILFLIWLCYNFLTFSVNIDNFTQCWKLARSWECGCQKAKQAKLSVAKIVHLLKIPFIYHCQKEKFGLQSAYFEDLWWPLLTLPKAAILSQGHIFLCRLKDIIHVYWLA